ncbi:MAG: hypothetical protein COA69_09470 [Robiginitomaculum sp.]|nr:MAG: hypothetical protein COA69_09470 [Robiginitomaculum sp.]
MDTKPFYQSRSYWGTFLIMFNSIVQITQEMSIEVISPGVIEWMNGSFVDSASQVGLAVGLVLTMVGRNKATKGIRLL